MGHIKEPDGVDFVINSRPLTRDEEIAIREYIRTYKARNERKPVAKKRANQAAASKRKLNAGKKVIAMPLVGDQAAAHVG
jgi:hypothetical protein